MTLKEEKDPIFSVIIPAYNNVKGLKRCIESVLSQSEIDLELLIMDDGSGAEVHELVEQFDDPKIRYEWESNSGGPARPRNRGIKSASGQWLCFMDHDDYWFPNKLSSVRALIENQPNMDIICHHEYHIDRTQTHLKSVRSKPSDENLYARMLIYGNPFSTSAVTVRRGFLSEFDLQFSEDRELVTAEDFDLWLRVVARTKNIGVVDDFLGLYFTGSGMSFDTSRHLNARHRVINMHLSDPLAKISNQRVFKYKVISGLELDLAKDAASNGSRKAASKHLAKALAKSPVTVVRRFFNATQRTGRSSVSAEVFKQSGVFTGGN
jgi:glycosyltransferase involved in cell wall biosynthesis